MAEATPLGVKEVELVAEEAAKGRLEQWALQAAGTAAGA